MELTGKEKSINLCMKPLTRTLLQDLVTALNAEIQPYRLQGRAKQEIRRSFTRSARALLTTNEQYWIGEAKKSRSLSSRARASLIRNLGRYVGVLPKNR